MQPSKGMPNNGSNYLVIVLLVLIIVIQAGSVFYGATNPNCAAALAAADNLIEAGNSLTASLTQEFEEGAGSEQMLPMMIDLQLKTQEIINQQNSALLTVLGNCR